MTSSLETDTRGCQIFLRYGGAESVCNRSCSSQTGWQDLCCDHARANKGDWIWWETEEERRAEQKEEEEAVLAREEEHFTNWSHFKSTVYRHGWKLQLHPFTSMFRFNSTLFLQLYSAEQLSPDSSLSTLADLSGFSILLNHLSWFGDGVLHLPVWSEGSLTSVLPPLTDKGRGEDGRKRRVWDNENIIVWEEIWSNHWGNEACECPVVWTHLHISFNAAPTLINH